MLLKSRKTRHLRQTKIKQMINKLELTKLGIVLSPLWRFFEVFGRTVEKHGGRRPQTE